MFEAQMCQTLVTLHKALIQENKSSSALCKLVKIVFGLKSKIY